MKKLVNVMDDDSTTPTPITSFILGGLERLEWELERIEIALRAEELAREDRIAIGRAFARITKECDVLRKWFQAAPIEETRN
jgi:hypothetical protein